MYNYRLFISTICLTMGLFSHTRVLAENHELYLQGAGGEGDSRYICDVVYTAIAGTQGFDFEDYSSLIDGDGDSKWCTSFSFADSHGGLPYYIIFRASEKIAPTWYRLVTGDDTESNPGRNWKNWKIYGANFSADNAALASYNITSPSDNNSRCSADWILIDDKNGYNLPASNTTELDVNMSNPSAEKFQYFLIEIYESAGGSIMQMAEMSFGSQANTIPDNPVLDKNFLSVPSCIDIKDGECFELPVSMTNEDDICSLQFDLMLPNGFVIATDGDGNAITKLSERANEKHHSVSFRKLNSGVYRFIIVSSSNATFANNSGVILSIGVKSSDGLPVGEYTVNIKNIILTNPNAIRFVSENISGIVKVVEPVIVTAKSYTREYGDSNPTFEYTVEGAALEGQPEIICEAAATTPVGEYPIIIKKGNVKNYNDTYVNGVLTITKAPLTISVGNSTKKQGEANPEFILSYNGFKNNETKEVLSKQPSVYCEATFASAPGEYDITVSGAEAQNYDINYTNGKLVVTDAEPVKVTAKSYTREYGEANPTFEYTIEGADLDGTPEIICEATATSPAGEYPIIIKKGSVKNYNDTYINGVLTITKAPLVVSIGNYTKKQGDDNPEFTLNYSGFKNNETEAVLKKKPTATTTATESSAPGEYNIVVNGGEAENYTLSYKNGKLTIIQADAVVITAKSYTREYGDANPTFEYTVEGATLEGQPEIICEATATSPVGEYPIIIRKGNVSNYNDTYINGVLTITKAPLTIGVGKYEKKQYDPMPEFVLNYKGFKNNETNEVLTKQPTVNCEANDNSAPGEYEIIVKDAEAENYEIQYVFGKLVVTEFDSNNIIFADANVKAICIANWDTNGDGELSVKEAAAVKSIGNCFKDNKEISSFNEFRYFTKVAEIGFEAFRGCTLTSITIPGNVKTIDVYAFYDCVCLSSIKVEEGNKVYDSRNECNAIIETETNTLITGCKNTFIPNSVTTIGSSAFELCIGLTDIIIPNSVKSIESDAFNGCSSLTSIAITNSVKSIGVAAFADCSSLTSIIIPSSVTRIDDYTFRGCTSLRTVIIEGRGNNLSE